MLWGQVKRFGLIGLAATPTHVFVAIAVEHVLSIKPFMANLSGFAAAVIVSYLGHAYYTFKIDPNHSLHFPKFLASAIIGLSISTAITFLVHHELGLAFWVAMLVVGVCVPIMTFLMLRLWVFRQDA